MNLNQVTVPVSNVDRAIEFYVKLGLKLIVHSNENYARFECPNGDSTFSVSKTESDNLVSETHIYFECENLDELVDDLMVQGIQFEMLPTDQRWLWREAHLRDPYGNNLILYHAGENRKNPPWRLGG